MTTYYQYIPAKLQEEDAEGSPYSGGKLYFYEAGTSTPLTVYKTASGTAHSSPIVLDSQGRIPDSSGVFMPSGESYKVVLHDSSDVEIYSVDNLVPYGADGSVTYAMIQDVSANKLLGSIAGGTVEEIALTEAGRNLLDDATTTDQLTTLGFTASIGELNANDGVTGNVQDQLDVLTAAVAAKPTELYGQIAANATITKGSGGYTVAAGATGYRTVTFDTEITDDYVVTLTAGPSASSAWGWTVHLTANSTTAFTIYMGDAETGVPRNDVWNFHLVYTAS